MKILEYYRFYEKVLLNQVRLGEEITISSAELEQLIVVTESKKDSIEDQLARMMGETTEDDSSFEDEPVTVAMEKPIDENINLEGAGNSSSIENDSIDVEAENDCVKVYENMPTLESHRSSSGSIFVNSESRDQLLSVSILMNQ